MPFPDGRRALSAGPTLRHMKPIDPKGAIGATKTPMHLLMYLVKPCASVARVLGLGAKKYGPFNWRRCEVCEETYIGAIGRHLGLHLEGERFDAESGESHLAHVAANCKILMDAEDCGTLVKYTGARSQPRPLQDAIKLLSDIMRDNVNAQDEAEKWLRAYAPEYVEYGPEDR